MNYSMTQTNKDYWMKRERRVVAVEKSDDGREYTVIADESRIQQLNEVENIKERLPAT